MSFWKKLFGGKAGEENIANLKPQVSDTPPSVRNTSKNESLNQWLKAEKVFEGYLIRRGDGIPLFKITESIEEWKVRYLISKVTLPTNWPKEDAIKSCYLEFSMQLHLERSFNNALELSIEEILGLILMKFSFLYAQTQRTNYEVALSIIQPIVLKSM